MKSSDSILVGVISSNPRLFSAVVFFCITALFIGSAFITVDVKEAREKSDPEPEFMENEKKKKATITITRKITAWISSDSLEKFQFNSKNNTPSSKTNESTYFVSKSECSPSRIESLPKGIISETSDLERKALSGPIERKGNAKSSKSLLAIAVGVKQKEVVDQMVKKFPFSNFTVVLFHYDGMIDKWSDLEWSDSVIHISAIKQTKWWFAKRFLHPDIVADYEYIFLWDEDIGVKNFHPGRYLEVVEIEGLEISQPGLDAEKSEVHYRFTERQKGNAHKRIYNFTHGVTCSENSTGFPCAGFVEMMAPVFSRAAWRCAWHMIQNDLVHAWGLDMKFGYCAQGDRTEKVGVVDREYIVHKGIPTLGASVAKKDSNVTSDENNRAAVVTRCYDELAAFNRRWQQAAEEDKCWVEPYVH